MAEIPAPVPGTTLPFAAMTVPPPISRFIVPIAALWLATLAPAQVQRAIAPDHVTFYTEPNYKGEALTVEAGATVDNLGALTRPSQRSWVYAISSVKVEGTARAIVYTAAGYGGERLEITTSVPDLYAIRRASEIGATWDRSIVSLTVTAPARTIVAAPAPRYEATPPPAVVVVPAPAGPPPAVRPPRPLYDRRTADAIVTRAFREVLDRNPDPEGLRTYRDRLIRERWSEAQLIQQLQRSREARAIDPDEAIARAYRDILGREPDPSGLAHYRSKWRDGWTQGRLRDDLRRSPEGRDFHIQSAITRAYRELLGRDPDPSGHANYERLMRERGYSEADIRRAIMDGDEYRERMRSNPRR
jgi:hypothetical protein